MAFDKPQYEKDVEKMLADIDEVKTWDGEPSSTDGTDYQVYAADGYTATEAANAVEHASVPGGHPISISSATSNWFWLGVSP